MLTEQESEILGILFGDGCLSRTERSVLITITGNKVDDEKYLLGHVRGLFLKAFDLELTSRYRHAKTLWIFTGTPRKSHRFCILGECLSD